MKRVIGLVCTLIIALGAAAPLSLAAEKDTASLDNGFELLWSSPKDGTDNVAVDNFSVKIRFNKEMEPKSEAVRKSNAAQFQLIDKKEGEKIPLKIYYSPKEKGLIMVAADYSDNNKKDVQIKGAREYTLTIGDKLQSADGSRFNHTQTITVKTLNQQRSTMVYMILMVAMMGGMVFFTIRSTKKAQEKEQEEKKNSGKGHNPYKEAKKTGKSVEEIVAKDRKAKAKADEALARQKAREAEIEAEILEEMRRAKNKRVSKPDPISAMGSSYRHPVRQTKTEEAQEPKKTSKGTTNPKNQSGKKKNSGGKKKKKK